MRIKIIRLLNLLGVDALLLGLFEKLALWTIKTIEHWLIMLEKFVTWGVSTLTRWKAAVENLLVDVTQFHKDALWT